MAFQAPPHFQAGHLAELGHVAHVAVALCTIHFCPEMGFMIEVNESGQDIHFDPGNGLSPLPIAMEGLNALSLGGNDQMASHAAFNRRDTGKRRAVRITMAIKTLNTEIGHMDLVIESDGLIGRVPFLLGKEPNTPRCREQNQYREHSQRQGFGHHTIVCSDGAEGDSWKNCRSLPVVLARTNMIPVKN